jgi:hypothetical protein
MFFRNIICCEKRRKTKKCIRIANLRDKIITWGLSITKRVLSQKNVHKLKVDLSLYLTNSGIMFLIC